MKLINSNSPKTEVSVSPEMLEKLRRLEKMDAYRKAYNAKPEVKAKRAAYMKKRTEEIRVAVRMMREAASDPEKAALLGLGIRVEMK